MGGIGNDDPSGYNLPNYGSIGYLPDHGFPVIYAIATLFRNVKIVFLDTQADEDTLGFPKAYIDNDDNGKPNLLWTWLEENYANYGIDVVSMSIAFEFSFDPSHIDKINQLYAKGIVFISAAGNNNFYYNRLYGLSTRSFFYPQLYQEWFAIGSVDHSGDSRLNPGSRSIFDGNAFGSAWGNSVWAADSIDWVMPGHFVPLPKWDSQAREVQWYERSGTSFSAPYFAATVAVLQNAFSLGTFAKCGYKAKPTRSQLMDILLDSASRSTFNQGLGWGWINLKTVYDNAYAEGFSSAYCFIPF